MTSQFRTIKVSDPRFEFDGLRYVTVKSKHLGRRGNVVYYIPKLDSETTQLPVYILLHGVYGSAWSWAMNAGAHKTADRMIKAGTIKPCILAMPSDGLWGDGSGYVEHEYSSYEKWITEDIPTITTEITNGECQIDSYSICGLSMGGYGALLLGAKHPDIFSAISAHSAITKWPELQPFVEENIYMINNPNGHQDVIDLMIQQKDRLPRLRFDCGVDDDLIEANRLLSQQLTDTEIAHSYEEFTGGHEWPYWEKHIEESLLFFNNSNNLL